MKSSVPSLRAALLAGGLLAATSVPALAGGVTWYVDDDRTAGSSSCDGTVRVPASIQAAILGAGPGDTVIVCPGTYRDKMNIAGDRDGLTVRALFKYAAVVEAPRVGDDDEDVLEIDGVDDVTIQWFAFRVPTGSGCVPYENVIDVNSSDGVRIMGNHVRTSGTRSLGACGYHDAVDLDDSTDFRVSSNILRDFRSNGVSMEGGSGGLILGNSIRYLHDTYELPEDGDGDDGIVGDGTDDLQIVANVIMTGEAHGDGPYLEDGIDIDGSGHRIRGNRVSGAEWGIYLETTASRIVGNRVTANRDGIDVQTGGNVVRDNDARGNQDTDCDDETTGTGTAGTDNTWTGNQGVTSDPDGLCAAP
jgi:parallel beta-helix repeat protein